MNEKERSYKQTLIELVEELQSFKYALFTWKEDLEKYRKQVAEFSKIFVKLSEITDKQLQEQNKIFEDKWAKLVATVGYVDSKVEKIYALIENKLVDLISNLSITLNKIDDSQHKTVETLNKLVNEQLKTNSLLNDIKGLMLKEVKIREESAVASKKLRKKIEQKLGE